MTIYTDNEQVTVESIDGLLALADFESARRLLDKFSDPEMREHLARYIDDAKQQVDDVRSLLEARKQDVSDRSLLDGVAFAEKVACTCLNDELKYELLNADLDYCLLAGELELARSLVRAGRFLDHVRRDLFEYIDTWRPQATA